ncbi:MAG: hypothetical protein RLZZ292_3521 [Bacteroidota bacterium]|jgi:uncharacterized damage-inducible protein DinB
MGLQKLIANYSNFNLWVNNQIVNWLKTVDETVLYQHTPSSFVSMDYTLQHILRTQIK